LGALVDAREGLEGDGRLLAARLVVRAADRHCGAPSGPILVEDHDLRSGIAKPLESKQGQECALASSGRTYEERVANVLNPEIQSKWGIAGGAAGDVRIADSGALFEVRVLVIARPHGGYGHELGKIDRMQDRPADIRPD